MILESELPFMSSLKIRMYLEIETEKNFAVGHISKLILFLWIRYPWTLLKNSYKENSFMFS